jgi:hypothetical protein
VGHVEEQHPRLIELRHERFGRFGRLDCLLGQLRGGALVAVVADHLVALLDRMTSDVGTHAPESDDPELHLSSPLSRLLEASRRTVSPALSSAGNRR